MEAEAIGVEAVDEIAASTSLVQTQLHFICLTGNFRKGVVRLNWVAKWVAALKRLKTTGLEVLRISTRKMLVSQLNIRGVCLFRASINLF